MVDWATLGGDAVLAAGGVVTAVIAARANRHAKGAARIGQDNAHRLEQVRRQTDARQRKLIRTAVEQVAAENPQLITVALADDLVRTVLETILTGRVDEPWHPHRRLDDTDEREDRRRGLE